MSATIFVTEACNLRCTYCYERDLGSATMTIACARQIAEFVSERSKPHDGWLMLNFHGGEPLLNVPAMNTIARVVRDRLEPSGSRLGVVMTTNGTIRTSAAIEFLEEFRPALSISIDGQARTHDAARRTAQGQPTSELALDFGRHARDIGLLVFARMTVTPDSAEDLAANVLFLAREGFSVIKPVPDYVCSAWDEAAIDRLRVSMAALKKSEPELHELGADVTILDWIETPRAKSPCRVGPSYLAIGVDGTLYPCSFVVGDERFRFGDVYRGIDEDVLRGLNEASRLADRSACSGCGLIDVCPSARCTYINYRMSGQLGAPSGEFCAIQGAMKEVCDGCQ